MITADTSVVVASFASWHEAHVVARDALKDSVRLPAHVLVESFSVLTRLPPPHRVAPEVVSSFLDQRFPGAPLNLSGKAHQGLIKEVPRLGISGGAIYDALIAATASRAGATLLTRDIRAVRTYESMSVDYEILP